MKCSTHKSTRSGFGVARPNEDISISYRHLSKILAINLKKKKEERNKQSIQNECL